MDIPYRKPKRKEAVTLKDGEYEESVRQYANMVYRIAFGYLKNVEDAQDITQDVLIQLFVSEKAFESSEHVRNWLIRVTINECKKVFRAPWRQQEDLEDYINALYDEQPDYRELYDALMKLDKKYRMPLMLFYIDGYSTREIGQLLKLPENTVSTRIRRGKEKMKDYFMEDLK